MFLCRLVQSWMSLHADTNQAPAGWYQRHLSACPTCRHAAQTTAQLVRRLQHSSDGLRQPVPPFLTRRVLASIYRPAGTVPAPPRRFPWPRFAWAMAAACLVLLAAGIWQSRQTGGPASTATVAELAPPRNLASTLPFKLPDRTHLLAYGAKLDEPLEQEWQRMLADARTAARSVAAAFVPEAAFEF